MKNGSAKTLSEIKEQISQAKSRASEEIHGLKKQALELIVKAYGEKRMLP